MSEPTNDVRMGDEQFLSAVLRDVYEKGLAKEAMGDAQFLEYAAWAIRRMKGYAELN